MTRATRTCRSGPHGPRQRRAGHGRIRARALALGDRTGERLSGNRRPLGQGLRGPCLPRRCRSWPSRCDDGWATGGVCGKRYADETLPDGDTPTKAGPAPCVSNATKAQTRRAATEHRAAPGRQESRDRAPCNPAFPSLGPMSRTPKPAIPIKRVPMLPVPPAPSATSGRSPTASRGSLCVPAAVFSLLRSVQDPGTPPSASPQTRGRPGVSSVSPAPPATTSSAHLVEPHRQAAPAAPARQAPAASPAEPRPAWLRRGTRRSARTELVGAQQRKPRPASLRLALWA